MVRPSSQVLNVPDIRKCSWSMKGVQLELWRTERAHGYGAKLTRHKIRVQLSHWEDAAKLGWARWSGKRSTTVLQTDSLQDQQWGLGTNLIVGNLSPRQFPFQAQPAFWTKIPPLREARTETSSCGDCGKLLESKGLFKIQTRDKHALSLIIRPYISSSQRATSQHIKTKQTKNTTHCKGHNERQHRTPLCPVNEHDSGKDPTMAHKWINKSSGMMLTQNQH